MDIDLTSFTAAQTELLSVIPTLGAGVVAVSVAAAGFGVVIRWVRRATRAAG